jgi:hypothetical protein
VPGLQLYLEERKTNKEDDNSSTMLAQLPTWELRNQRRFLLTWETSVQAFIKMIPILMEPFTW